MRLTTGPDCLAAWGLGSWDKKETYEKLRVVLRGP